MATRQVTVRGARLAYDDTGEGSPVLLLHGFPFNRSLWSEQAEALSSKYRIITPDLRGFGESAAEDEEATATMETLAQDAAALLDELKIDRAVIGGLSMGGYVALAFTRLFPLRVRALILADTRAQADSPEAQKGREETAAKALREGIGTVADAMLPKLFAPATAAEHPEIVERVRAMIMGTSTKGAAAALRGMAERPDRTHFLAQILAPTLIVVGGEDAITPPKDSEVMRREIRGSRLVVIPNAGHVSNLERPHEFNQAVGIFLDELTP